MKNKALMITYIIILSCIAIGLIIFMVLGIMGKTRFFSISSKSNLLWSENYKIEEINKISSDVNAYDIYVNAGTSSEIEVQVNGSNQEKDNIKVELVNGELKINQEKSTVCFGFCFQESFIKIYVPENLTIDTDLKTSSGEITVHTNLMSDNVNIKSTSGDILVDYINRGEVKSTSGEIEIKKINEGDVSTTSGDIEIGEVDTLKATSTSGEIEVRQINSQGDIKTTSGDVDIKNFMVLANSKIEATSGDVYVNLLNDAYVIADSKSGDKNVYSGRGDVELQVKTTSGDIDVLKSTN